MIIAGALFANPRVQLFDGNGDPLAGGKLYFYAAGTSTPEDTFTDSALTTPHTNPVILDADGRAALIYLSATGYKVILHDADDVEVWSADGVSDVGQVLLAELGVQFAAGARDVSSGYTVTEADNTVTVASTGGANPCVIYLPSVATRLWPVVIKQRGTVDIAVTPDGADTIDGVAAAYTVAAGNSPHFPALLLLPDADNTDWIIAGAHRV